MSSVGLLGVLVGLVVLGVAAFFSIKSESAKSASERVDDAQEQTEHWRSSFQAENTRAEALSAEVRAQRELKHSALTELAAERMKTDLTGFMKQVADAFAATNRRLEQLEERLNRRLDLFSETQQKQIDALQAIVDLLNGDET